jgi:hypothetical protein
LVDRVADELGGGMTAAGSSRTLCRVSENGGHGALGNCADTRRRAAVAGQPQEDGDEDGAEKNEKSFFFF